MKIKIISLILLVFISISLARTGARYLIICPDSYIQTLQPLADWKTKKGVKAIIAPLSVAGSSASLIKNYILNAYNTWEIRPEYILIVGTSSLVPASGSSDDYYADMIGNYRIELSIGRLPCTTIDQCNNILNKIIKFERYPYIEDSTWFMKGTTIVREDGATPPDDVFWENARYLHNLWQHAGYTQIDSFSRLRGHTSANVNAAINDGRMYVVYRGEAVSNWWSPFAMTPSNLSNGNKTPIVVSGTCQTMSVDDNGYLGNTFMNAGTALLSKGAVAFFGTTNVASGSNLALNRGIVSKGFFQAIFQDKVRTIGDAAKRGKFIVDSIQPPNYTTARYTEWELFGDPEMQTSTNVSKKLRVIYDSVISTTQTNFPVTVFNELAYPLSDAMVCIMMDTTIYSWGRTNSQGQINLPIQFSTSGIMDITVTAQNHIPYEGTVRIIPVNIPYVTYDSCIIIDSISGNNDRKINPGESIQMQVFLKNNGSAVATGVQAILSTSNLFITISDSIKNFGTITQDSIVGSQGYYQFLVSPNCYNNYQLNFQLNIQDNQGHNWSQPITLLVSAGKLVYVSSFINDSAPAGNGNSILGPRESAKLLITLSNLGENLNQVSAVLHTNSQYLIITDSTASFGDISQNGNATNNADQFAIIASPNMPKNYPINFSVTIFGFGRTYIYHDSAIFNIITETGTTSDPTGPDAYGYWAYDNTDTLSGHAPVYSWFEIGPSGPGSLIDSITNRDAAVVALRLPFTFKYYGQNYDSISVCSNGFLAMGRTNYRFGSNSGIPDTAGPPRMIAPFWCDLNPDENLTPAGAGDIYQYNDAVNHRWIVEFYGIAHYGQTNVRETFQAIVIDPNYYPTQTGDGELLYLYNTIADATVATVGIENQTQTQGIQYVYNNIYNSSAATIENGRAIKFSTQIPANFQSPWVVLTHGVFSDSIGGNNNGIPEPNENIRFTTYLCNHGSTQAQNAIVTLRNIDGNAMVLDSVFDFGNIAAGNEVNNQTNPFQFQIATNPSDTIIDFILAVQAQNYSNIEYISVGIQRHPGIEVNSNKSLTYYNLKQNAPNPFRYSTNIEYSLPFDQKVELKIYNATGRLIKTLIIGNQKSGVYNIYWNGRDNKEKHVPCGVYYYIFKPEFTNYVTRKMIIY